VFRPGVYAKRHSELWADTVGPWRRADAVRWPSGARPGASGWRWCSVQAGREPLGRGHRPARGGALVKCLGSGLGVRRAQGCPDRAGRGHLRDRRAPTGPWRGGDRLSFPTAEPGRWRRTFRECVNAAPQLPKGVVAGRGCWVAQCGGGDQKKAPEGAFLESVAISLQATG
jgi:hypothetical protein